MSIWLESQTHRILDPGENLEDYCAHFTVEDTEVMERKKKWHCWCSPRIQTPFLCSLKDIISKITTIPVLCLVVVELPVFPYTREPGDVFQEMRTVAPVGAQPVVSGELTDGWLVEFLSPDRRWLFLFPCISLAHEFKWWLGQNSPRAAGSTPFHWSSEACPETAGKCVVATLSG